MPSVLWLGEMLLLQNESFSCSYPARGMRMKRDVKNVPVDPSAFCSWTEKRVKKE